MGSRFFFCFFLRVTEELRCGWGLPTRRQAWVASESLADPAFQVLSVVRLNEKADSASNKVESSLVGLNHVPLGRYQGVSHWEILQKYHLCTHCV